MQSQREFAVEIVRRLRGAGYEALLAGGCVRDELLGKTPKDYDVATNATPEEIRLIFGRQRTLAIGAAFGVVAVLGPRGREPVEVATFREESEYSDGRRPDSVHYSTPQADALRRDFTINGLFLDPLTGQVIDYVGGQADLARKVVRAIGNPQERLEEDKLRLLRAVRCAATLEFELDLATAAAVRSMASQIAVVSAERITAELRRILVDPSRRRGVELVAELGLLGYIFPELKRMATPSESRLSDWMATLKVLERLHEPSFPLALAAALHRSEQQRPAHAAGRRLRLANKEIERADWILGVLPILKRASSQPWPRIQRILAQEGAAEAVQLLEAVAGDEHEAAVFCRVKRSLPREVLDPPPLVTGDDLIAHGLRPGPDFGRLLEQIRDAQLEGRISGREEALQFANKLAGTQ